MTVNKKPYADPMPSAMTLRARPPFFSMLLILFLVPLFFGCGHGVMFDNTKKIEGNVWNKDEKVRFDVPVTDTLDSYRFYLNVRHSTDYRYSNIYFFINTLFPDGKTARDTVQCILARPDGKWLGRGFTGIKDNQVLLRTGLRFPRNGTYVFEFEQAMRVDDLEGITDIGLRLEKE